MYIQDHFVQLTKTVDRSIPTIGLEPLPQGYANLFPFFSPEGRDNKIIRCTGFGAVEKLWGTKLTDTKYGHTGIVAQIAAKHGAMIDGCRLMPDDSERASMVWGVILREIKVDVDVTGYELEFYQEAADVEGFDGDVHSASNETIDTSVSGEFKIPLGVIITRGRGKYGNNYSLDINVDKDLTAQSADGLKYTLDMYKVENGTTVSVGGEEAQISFTLNTAGTVHKNTSLLMGFGYAFAEFNTRFEDHPLYLAAFDENADFLTDKLAAVTSADSAFDVDVLLLSNIDTYDHLEQGAGHVDITDVMKPLSAGSDGSFELGGTVKDANGDDIVVTEAHIETVRNQLLVQFYSCDIDDDLLDERLVQSSIAFGCNFNAEVTKAMYEQLAVLRRDIVVIGDVGVQATFEAARLEAINRTGGVAAVDAHRCAINIHCGRTTDRSRNVNTSANYALAKLYAQLFGGPNKFAQLAGEAVAEIDNMKLSWILKKTKTDEIGKAMEAHVIMATALYKTDDNVKKIAFMTESSLETQLGSKLMSTRNALVIGYIMRYVSIVSMRNIHNIDGKAGTELALDLLISEEIPSQIPEDFKVEHKLRSKLSKLGQEVTVVELAITPPNVTDAIVVEVYADRPQA